MNLKQINQIITDYNKLYALVITKTKILEKIDKKYNTAKKIESISFEDNAVFVTCDDTCCGYYETTTFNFPVVWLSKTDAELEKIVVNEIKINEEKARKAQEKQKAIIKQQNLKLYKKLKAQFEK